MTPVRAPLRHPSGLSNALGTKSGHGKWTHRRMARRSGSMRERIPSIAPSNSPRRTPAPPTRLLCIGHARVRTCGCPVASVWISRSSPQPQTRRSSTASLRTPAGTCFNCPWRMRASPSGPARGKITGGTCDAPRRPCWSCSPTGSACRWHDGPTRVTHASARSSRRPPTRGSSPSSSTPTPSPTAGT